MTVSLLCWLPKEGADPLVPYLGWRQGCAQGWLGCVVFRERVQYPGFALGPSAEAVGLFSLCFFCPEFVQRRHVVFSPTSFLWILLLEESCVQVQSTAALQWRDPGPSLSHSPRETPQPYSFCLFVCFLISWRLITLQYCSGFCHILKWISHGFTCVPHPDPPPHLPLHPFPLGLPSAPGPSTCLMHPAWAGDLFHPW